MIVDALFFFSPVCIRQRGYLRRDLIAFRNFNPFRSSDLMFVVICIQTIACYFWGLSVVQWSVIIVAWRLIHTVGLGLILHLQSNYDSVVKSFQVESNNVLGCLLEQTWFSPKGTWLD